eukprot:gene35467-33620_t
MFACGAKQHTQPEKALELLSEMQLRGLVPGISTYYAQPPARAAISAYGKCGQPEKAVELLWEMHDRGLFSEMQSRQLVPDIFTYNVVLSTCAKCEQPGTALELLSEMRVRDVMPNTKSYNATISACAKGGQPEKALELLSEMQGRGLEPDDTTYGTAISACHTAPGKVMELLSEMQARGLMPSMLTYNAAVWACERGHQPEMAQQIRARRDWAGQVPLPTPPPATSELPATSSDVRDRRRVCCRFLNGRCAHGDACHKSHVSCRDHYARNRRAGVSAPVCCHWLLGRCTYGDACRKPHVDDGGPCTAARGRAVDGDGGRL